MCLSRCIELGSQCIILFFCGVSFLPRRAGRRMVPYRNVLAVILATNNAENLTEMTTRRETV